MKQKSKITGEEYEDGDMVFFRNCVQSAFYISQLGRDKLVDLFLDDNNKLVFVFAKKDHEKVKFHWIKTDNDCCPHKTME